VTNCPDYCNTWSLGSLSEDQVINSSGSLIHPIAYFSFICHWYQQSLILLIKLLTPTAGFLNKKLIRRWDSERELSLQRHRTRTTKYNTLVHKFRHRSTRLCVGTHVYQIQWNNAMLQPLRRSRSFKVTDFGTNQKLIYDFLLVVNTNLPLILHHFQVMADYWSNFCCETGVPHFNAVARGDPLPISP